MKYTSAFIVFLLSCNLFAQSVFNKDDYDFEKAMDFYNIPGVSISVIENKEISWASGFGKNINKETIFQVSALSKSITAVGIFKLIDAGLIDLDTDVNNYLKSWKIEETMVTESRKITVRMLLSHTAGIHESGPKGYLKDDEIGSLDDILKDIHIRYYPGLKRRYSWSGYSILQKLIEDITNLKFEEYMQTEVLDLLKMNQSSFTIPENTEQISKGHNLFGDEIEGGWRVYPGLAASGLWSTPTDIGKFIIEIEKILSSSDYTGIISKESAKQIISYQKGGWGLGTNLKFQGDDIIFRHSGENAGYISYFIARPYIGDGIVIMTNGENAWKIIMEIMHTIKEYKKWGI